MQEGLADLKRLSSTGTTTHVSPVIDGDDRGNAVTGEDGGKSLAINPSICGTSVHPTKGNAPLIDGPRVATGK